MVAPGGDRQMSFWSASAPLHRADRNVAERVIGEMQRDVGEEDEAGRRAGSGEGWALPLHIRRCVANLSTNIQEQSPIAPDLI